MNGDFTNYINNVNDTICDAFEESFNILSDIVHDIDIDLEGILPLH